MDEIRKKIYYTEDNEMTVNGFILELQNLPFQYRNLPIKIEAKNRKFFSLKIKYLAKDHFTDKAEAIILTAE